MARKFSILAGSKEICSEKISGIFIGYLVGPIIHCSPNLARTFFKNNWHLDYKVFIRWFIK